MSGVDICASFLVHSLCENLDIPILVTDLIAAYLDKRDLFTISTLSHKLNAQAQPTLYQDITLDLSEDAPSAQRAILLLRTLLTSSAAANYVRSLSLVGDPLFQWRCESVQPGGSIEESFAAHPPELLFDLSCFTPTDITTWQNISNSLALATSSLSKQISLPELCLGLLSLTSHLRDLHITSDYLRYVGVRNVLQSMLESGCLQTLQSCSFCLDLLHGMRRHVNAVREWDSVLLAPFFGREIRAVAGVMALRPENVIRIRQCSITRLVLHHCQLQESDLNSLLAATPKLVYLEYHSIVNYGWLRKQSARRGTFGLDSLFDALHHVSETLNELVTTQRFSDDSPHFHCSYGVDYEPPFRQRDDLSKIEHLQTLSIPYASILGWSRKGNYHWDWANILPTSLRQLTLTDHLIENFCGDCWTDESLMPIITSLLDWLMAHEQEDTPPSFALLLLQSDTDFNEPVRRELSRLCYERGISCSITKSRNDRKDTRPVSMPRGRGRGRAGGRGRPRGR